MKTTNEMAKMLGVSPGRVRQLVNMKRITKVKLMGNSLVFSDKSEVIKTKWGRPRKEVKIKKQVVTEKQYDTLLAKGKNEYYLGEKKISKEEYDLLIAKHKEQNEEHYD